MTNMFRGDPLPPGEKSFPYFCNVTPFFGRAEYYSLHCLS